MHTSMLHVSIFLSAFEGFFFVEVVFIFKPYSFFQVIFLFWVILIFEGVFIFGGAASQYTGLSARPSACQFQLASGEVLLTILTSTIVGEYRGVFYNYPGAKNEQSHTQTV